MNYSGISSRLMGVAEVLSPRIYNILDVCGQNTFKILENII